MEAFRKIQKRDVQQGFLNEVKVLPILRSYFKDDSIQLISGRSVMDYSSDTALFELKTRTNYKTKYDTTMIGINKIEKAQSVGKDAYFIFKFTDCICYIKYERKLFETFETKLAGRFDRGMQELKHYIFIPIEHLTEMTV